MTRPLLAFALLAGAFACTASTCSQQVVQDAAAINGTLNDPQVQTAIANLQKLNQGVVCFLSAGASLTAAVAADLKATATVNGATIGATATATICNALGGMVPATGAIPPSAAPAGG